MFKIFKNIGLIILIIGSFMYTEKLVSVVKEYDDIMIKLKENKYSIKPKEAVIGTNTIVPGINGKKIDIEKSYQKMREYGKYNEDLIKYNSISPKEKLKDNPDKFIIRGSKEKQVAIIFIVNDEKQLKNILKSNIKPNIFFTNRFYKNSKDLIYKLSNNYLLGSYQNNETVNKYIKKIINQEKIYCYTEDKDLDILKKCSLKKYYTIVPNIVITNNSLSKLEKNINSGSIISIKVSDFDNIIRYINNKGYKIVDLDELLDENNN